MLKLERGIGQSIVIDGDRIKVTLSSKLGPEMVKLTISFNNGAKNKEVRLSKDGKYTIKDNIKLTVCWIRPSSASLGIDAPEEISINCEEKWKKIKAEQHTPLHERTLTIAQSLTPGLEKL